MKSRVQYSASSRAFVWRGPFEERHLPKGARFLLHPEKKVWYTRSYLVAARLRELMDEPAKRELSRKLLNISPWAGPLPYPPGETPYPHQLEGARWILERNRCYLGFDPGLGKTPTAVIAMNALVHDTLARRIRGETIEPDPLFVYVSPRFLEENVADEFRRWNTFNGVVRILDKMPEVSEWPSIVVVADSLLHREKHAEELDWYLNYAERAGRKVYLFVDEAHRFSFPETERTRSLLGYDFNYFLDEVPTYEHVPGLADRFEKIVYLSGTPTNGRPIELYPILDHSAPETINFMNRYEYGDRYCDPKDNGFGKTYLGESNVEELAERIKPFMLRKRKDILGLTPVVSELLIVSGDMDPRLAKLDAELLKKYSPEDLVKAEIRKQAVADKLLGEEDDLHFSTYRRLLGELKVPFAAEIIRSMLEETEESILVGGLHTAPVLALAAHLGKYKPYLITGETKQDMRLPMAKCFQQDPLRRLFIGNIRAMGVGLTLTKATRVLLFEFSYSPSDNDQFIDRTHRIGQTGAVFAQYLTFKNSIDRKVAESFIRKKKTTAIL